MPTLKAVLCAALATCVLLGPASAEARFGKRSSSSSSNRDGNRDGNRGNRDERPRPQRPRVHEASPIGQEREDSDGDAPRRRRQRVVVRSPLAEIIIAGALIGVTPPPVRHVSSRLRVRETRYDPVPLLVRLGVQGGRMADGGALGLSMAMEGRRLGFDTRITGLALPAEDYEYSRDTDRITLLGAHVTAALWAGPRGRVRMEAGVSSAHAPSIIFVGPSLGASAEVCIGRSPVDVEARIQATPFPHRQLDAQAGLALHLGAFNMRGGWRGLYLNDAGHVDGVVNEENLGGPYFGLGLTF